MEAARVTFEIYRSCADRAARLAAANWPVLASLFVYSLIWALAFQFAIRLGFVGGFLLAIVRSACVASFLYLVEQMIRTSKVSLDDFRQSFGSYLGDVLGLFFLHWIVSMLAVPVLGQIGGVGVLLAVYLVVFTLFNAVPELIYWGHHSSFELLTESYAFISENWVEWFPPNFLLAAGALAIMAIPFGYGLLAYVLETAIFALYLYFAMVFRGLLFGELHGTTRRGRVFRWQARS